MPENREGLAVAWEWVEKAENDLRSAAHLLKMEDCPTDTVCFHAQGIPFRKIHDLGELMALMPSRLRPSLDDTEQAKLTEYATVTRYPGEYEPISVTEARHAIKTARRIRGEVRRLLKEKPPFSKESI